MRGSPFHNLLVAQLERACCALGAFVRREYRIATPALDGFCDLLVTFKLLRIAIEVELTTDRIRWDIQKAAAMNAVLLLIVFPNGRLARTAQKCVDELKTSGKAAALPVYCLTLGAALNWIKTSQVFDVDSNTSPTSIHQNTPQKVQLMPAERIN